MDTFIVDADQEKDTGSVVGQQWIDETVLDDAEEQEARERRDARLQEICEDPDQELDQKDSDFVMYLGTPEEEIANPLEPPVADSSFGLSAQLHGFNFEELPVDEDAGPKLTPLISPPATLRAPRQSRPEPEA